jgi:predicted GTPase
MKKKNVQEKDSLEHLSALWALKVITRAHVCLLLLDAKEGLCAQVCYLITISTISV